MYIFPVSINILIMYSHAIPNSSHKKKHSFHCVEVLSSFGSWKFISRAACLQGGNETWKEQTGGCIKCDA